MVVPCFVAFFRAGSGSEAFTDIPDSGLLSSGTAIAPTSASAAMAAAVAATIGHGLGHVFGIIADMLSDGLTVVSLLAFFSTLALTLVVSRGMIEDVEQ